METYGTKGCTCVFPQQLEIELKSAHTYTHGCVDDLPAVIAQDIKESNIRRSIWIIRAQ